MALVLSASLAWLALVAPGAAANRAGGRGTDQPPEVVAALDIVITSDASPLGAEHGSILTYTFTISNSGEATVSAISVDDDNAGHVGDIGELAPGQSTSLSKSARVPDSGLNSARASGFDPWGRPVTAEGAYSVRVFIADVFPDIALSKTADVQSALPGARVRYTLTVREVGGDSTGESPVFVADDYDETWMEVVDAAGGSVSGGAITWNLGTMPAEGVRTITYVLRVRPGAPVGLRIANTARAATDADDLTENNTASANVRVSGEKPSLPFTENTKAPTSSRGPHLPFTGPADALLPLASIFALLGVGLRRLSGRIP